MPLLDRLTGATDNADDSIGGKVVWTVSFDVDDFDGPGWYITSPKGEYGPLPSQSDAVDTAFRKADFGDVVEIWDEDAKTPELERVC